MAIPFIDIASRKSVVVVVISVGSFGFYRLSYYMSARRVNCNRQVSRYVEIHSTRALIETTGPLWMIGGVQNSLMNSYDAVLTQAFPPKHLSLPILKQVFQH